MQGINDLAMPLIVTYLSATQMSSQENVDSFEESDKIDYDAVLNGTIMESVTDDQLHEVNSLLLCLT